MHFHWLLTVIRSRQQTCFSFFMPSKFFNTLFEKTPQHVFRTTAMPHDFVSCCTLIILFFTRCDVICDIYYSTCTQTETYNLFVKYYCIRIKVDYSTFWLTGTVTIMQCLQNSGVTRICSFCYNLCSQILNQLQSFYVLLTN